MSANRGDAHTTAVGAAGFSLVELMVVLAIASMVLAVSVPSLLVGGGARVDAAASAVAGELRRARSDALAQSRPQAVLIDLQAHRVSRANDAGRSLPEGAEMKLLTARSEQLDAQRGYIRFFPDGSATGGRLDFGHDGHARVAVDVDWLTGSVRIVRPGDKEPGG